GVMAMAFATASLFGRPNSSWRALVLAAAILVAINPWILRYDAGFQLSFLAVLGILLFYKKIEALLRKAQYNLVKLIVRRPITKDMGFPALAAENKFGLVSILAVTFAAQVFTMPLIFYNFGNISYVSPLTNILVVPISSAVIVSGFLAAVGGVIGGAAGPVLSAPAWLFSSYIWKVVAIFS
ncbi:MAG: ComEC/Rec2 family competence protein, partial [Candidatus Spechtbacteria bacterium]|nr:ComEC/Rec2 family competence protein [Candidatus Spechtbacteria bacterium]